MRFSFQELPSININVAAEDSLVSVARVFAAIFQLHLHRHPLPPTHTHTYSCSYKYSYSYTYTLSLALPWRLHFISQSGIVCVCEPPLRPSLSASLSLWLKNRAHLANNSKAKKKRKRKTEKKR